MICYVVSGWYQTILLVLNNVSINCACWRPYTKLMYSYSVQEKSTLLGLVFFMKNSALPEHHVTAEFNAKM